MTVFKLSFKILYIQRCSIVIKLYDFPCNICTMNFSIFTSFLIVYFLRKICNLAYLPRSVIWLVEWFIYFCNGILSRDSIQKLYSHYKWKIMWVWHDFSRKRNNTWSEGTAVISRVRISAVFQLWAPRAARRNVARDDVPFAILYSYYVILLFATHSVRGKTTLRSGLCTRL